MNVISIDLETRSSVDINKAGVYRYAESPDFDILLFGVSVDGGPVTVYDLASGEELPEQILYNDTPGQPLQRQVPRWLLRGFDLQKGANAGTIEISMLKQKTTHCINV